MATRREEAGPRAARPGESPVTSVPVISDISQSSASEIIKAPQKPKRGSLDPHDFADGGGGGGSEAFSRKKTKK